MKTQEQHKQDVINYLRLTAQHKFLRGETDVFTFIETIDSSFFKVINGVPHHTPLNIDLYVNEYKGDTKNVIKNMIFYGGHGYKSIKNTYYEKLLTTK